MEQVINYLPNWSQKRVATGSTVYKDSHKCALEEKRKRRYSIRHTQNKERNAERMRPD